MKFSFRKTSPLDEARMDQINDQMAKIRALEAEIKAREQADAAEKTRRENLKAFAKLELHALNLIG